MISAEEIQEIRDMALKFQDPIRGKILFLIALVENLLEKDGESC